MTPYRLTYSYVTQPVDTVAWADVAMSIVEVVNPPLSMPTVVDDQLEDRLFC